MEEKRKDLKSSKQRVLIKGIVDELAKTNPSFYYLSTIELAAEIKQHIHSPAALSHDDFQLVKDLKRQDIQLLLSLHSG